MKNATIVYASLTGNTEEIAEFLVDEFKSHDVEVELIEADDADEDSFADADICVVATFTYTDGDVPDDLEDFFEELPDQDLAGKVFGVVGSGDDDMHHETFCNAAIEFDKTFEKTGAVRGAELVKIDNAYDDDDVPALKAFVKNVVEFEA